MFKDLIFSAENSYGGNYSISDDGLTVTVGKSCNHCVFTNASIDIKNLYFEVTCSTFSNGIGAFGIGGLETCVLNAGVHTIIPKNSLFFALSTTSSNTARLKEFVDGIETTSCSIAATAIKNNIFVFGLNSKDRIITIYKNGVFLFEHIYQTNFDISSMYIWTASTWNSISATNTFNFGATEFKYPDLANLYKNNQMLYVDKNSAVWGVTI